MQLIRDLALAVSLALAVGLSSASLVLNQRAVPGLLRFGVWVVQPTAETNATNPYAAAAAATLADLPLGIAEGLALTATYDAEGRPLSSRCTYAVEGGALPARLWTLTAYDDGGRPVTNASSRSGFHSRELLRRADGAFAIAVSPTPRPGNWIPTASSDGLILVLRLYDTPLATGLPPAEFALPVIRRESCL